MVKSPFFQANFFISVRSSSMVKNWSLAPAAAAGGAGCVGLHADGRGVDRGRLGGVFAKPLHLRPQRSRLGLQLIHPAGNVFRRVECRRSRHLRT